MGIFDWKHWLVILIVVILVFGTKKLKTFGSDLGESIKGFRDAMKSGEEGDKPADSSTAASTATDSLNKPQTIDGQARKVEDPAHKH